MTEKEQLLKNPLLKEVLNDFAIELKKSMVSDNVWSVGATIESFCQSQQTVKEWEILKYKNQKTNEILYPSQIEQIFRYKEKYLIHSVNRLFDCEVFTVGDKVEEFGNIFGFEILADNSMHCKCGYVSEITFLPHISNIKKAKEVLFTTTDGKPVYEGDEFFCIDDWSVGSEIAQSVNYDGLVTFLIKSNAEEYVLMNKPCLSVNDIIKGSVPNFLAENKSPLSVYFISEEQLIELAKTKI